MGRAEELFQRIESRGLAAIDLLIADAKSEEAFLDFKRSADRGVGQRLHDDDRKNLFKALSGFANSDGGVLVWGVGAPSNGDVASSKHPIVDCKAFAARIDDKVSGGTTPPVMGVRSVPIPDESGTAGYVATLIPPSTVGPHQSTDSNRYLIRAGSSFQPVTHTVLAGMFGKRPQAHVVSSYAITSAHHVLGSDGEAFDVFVNVMAANDTAVVARDAYMSFRVWTLPSEKSSFTFFQVDPKQWEANSPVSPRFRSFLSSDTFRLAPFSVQGAINIRAMLVPPFSSGIKVELHVGCDGAPPFHDQWEASLDELNRAAAPLLQIKPLFAQSKAIDLGTGAELLGLKSNFAL